MTIRSFASFFNGEFISYYKYSSITFNLFLSRGFVMYAISSGVCCTFCMSRTSTEDEHMMIGIVFLNDVFNPLYASIKSQPFIRCIFISRMIREGKVG